MNLSSVFVHMSVPEFVCGATCVFVFAPIWMIICIDTGRVVRVRWKKEFLFSRGSSLRNARIHWGHVAQE